MKSVVEYFFFFLRTSSSYKARIRAINSRKRRASRVFAAAGPKEETHVRQRIEKARKEQKRREAPPREHSDFCVHLFPLPNLPAPHSITPRPGRPNKPLMRNGCYSCTPRYFRAITIYHICLSTVLCPPSFFSLSRGRRERALFSVQRVRFLIFVSCR